MWTRADVFELFSNNVGPFSSYEADLVKPLTCFFRFLHHFRWFLHLADASEERANICYNKRKRPLLASAQRSLVNRETE